MSERPMSRWGVMLPNFDAFRTGEMPLVAAARAAEDLGFDAVWVGDHLAFHPPILEATMSLAAAGASTSRIALGTAILLAPMRQPVWTAKAIQTLEHLAPGRSVLGFGVGGEHPPEWRAAGAEVRGRGRRLDEFLELLPDLLGGREVHHEGSLVVHTPPLEPVMEMPPIVIGGRSDAAIRRAAVYGDAWQTVWMDPDDVTEKRGALAAAAAELERPVPETTMVMFTALDPLGDTEACRRDAARLFRGQYDLPWEVVQAWTLCGDLDQVVEGYQRFVDVGVTGFVTIPARPDVVAQYELLAEVGRRLRW